MELLEKLNIRNVREAMLNTFNKFLKLNRQVKNSDIE